MKSTLEKVQQCETRVAGCSQNMEALQEKVNDAGSLPKVVAFRLPAIDPREAFDEATFPVHRANQNETEMMGKDVSPIAWPREQSQRSCV